MSTTQGEAPNSAPHLLNEDRQEYERILDEALRTAPDRPDLAAVGQRLNLEQLRTMALNATALITAAAAAEYDHYVKVREELRESASPHTSSDTVYSSSRSATGPAPSALPRSGTHPAATDHHARAGLGRRFGAAVLGAGQPGGRRISDGVAPSRWVRMSYGRRLLAALLGLRVRPAGPSAAGARSPRKPEQPAAARTRPASRETPARETTEAAGAGLFAVFAVLAPVLSGTTAAFFILIGLVLKLFTAESEFGRTMFAAGWLFGAVAVGAIAVCAVGLLVTALRSRSQPTTEAARYRELSDEQLARAREAWRHALLERGILPFLRAALDDCDTAPRAGTPPRRLPAAFRASATTGRASPPRAMAPVPPRPPARVSPAPTSEARNTSRSETPKSGRAIERTRKPGIHRTRFPPGALHDRRQLVLRRPLIPLPVRR